MGRIPFGSPILEGKIQERYGVAKDQARKQIDDWFASQGFLIRRFKMLLGPGLEPGFLFWLGPAKCQTCAKCRALT